MIYSTTHTWLTPNLQPHLEPLVNSSLSLADGEPLSDATLYRSTVGALQYLTITRSDKSFVVNKACQFIAQPTIAHWIVGKRILRYLKGTSAHDISFHISSSFYLHSYTDAD